MVGDVAAKSEAALSPGEERMISVVIPTLNESESLEQLHRELTSRAEKMQNEITEQKKRVKSLQKDLATEREELKALKQFDPARMKKSLDANKKKMAEKITANDLLQSRLPLAPSPR